MTDRGDEERERPAFPLYFEDEKPSVGERIRRAFRRDDDEPAPPSTVVVPGRRRPEVEAASDAPEAADVADPEPAAVPPDAGPVQRATIQLLPGRLTAEDPGVIEQEIRFLKTRGGGEVVTLGWDVAEPPGHVTLDHPSIRPRHARMTWHEGSWWIESLVPGHEVEVNGRAVPCEAPARRLADGDHIRLGEVAFRFKPT